MKSRIQMVIASAAVVAILTGPSVVSATRQFAVLDAGYLKQPLTETAQAGPGPVCPGVCLVR
jgi:hypothetical protein